MNFKNDGIVRVDFGDKDGNKIDWIDNKFVSCRELFPSWNNVQECLEKYLNDFGDWMVVELFDQVAVCLEFKNVCGSEKQLSDFYGIPIEFLKEVTGTCDKAMDDYLVSNNKFYGIQRLPKDEMLTSLRNEITRREKLIISMGGRTVREEIRFRLGLPASDGISFVETKIVVKNVKELSSANYRPKLEK